MNDGIRRRIIGESPPRYGGKRAYSTVTPCHSGGCQLRYTLGGKDAYARFPNYTVARTAAIRAVFSAVNDIDGVCVSSDNGNVKAPVFQNAADWLNTLV